MSPVITHPMLGVILNRWVTVDASRSLSWNIEIDVYEETSSLKLILHPLGLCVG